MYLYIYIYIHFKIILNVRKIQYSDKYLGLLNLKFQQILCFYLLVWICYHLVCSISDHFKEINQFIFVDLRLLNNRLLITINIPPCTVVGNWSSLVIFSLKFQKIKFVFSQAIINCSILLCVTGSAKYVLRGTSFDTELQKNNL